MESIKKEFVKFFGGDLTLYDKLGEQKASILLKILHDMLSNNSSNLIEPKPKFEGYNEEVDSGITIEKIFKKAVENELYEVASELKPILDNGVANVNTLKDSINEFLANGDYELARESYDNILKIDREITQLIEKYKHILYL